MAGEQWIAEIQRQAREKGAPVASDDAAWTARCVDNALLNADGVDSIEVAEDGAIEVVVASTFRLTLRIAPDTGAITGQIESML